MEMRIPGLMRTRATPSELIEVRPPAPDSRRELGRLATCLIIDKTP